MAVVQTMTVLANIHLLGREDVVW